MFELTMNGKVIPFKFGVGFLREINKTVQVPVDGAPGTKNNIGLRVAIGKLYDGDVETLVQVLDLANKGQNPRVTVADIENYIDDEDTDIEKLFDDMMGFLKESNATRLTVKKLLEAIAEQEAKEKK